MELKRNFKHILRHISEWKYKILLHQHMQWTDNLWSTQSFKFVYNDDKVYIAYKPKIDSTILRVNQTTSLKGFSSRPTELCGHYGFCRANGNCTCEDPVCQCIQGFSPKSQENWNLMAWSLGCVSNKPLSCHE
ncbi:hypothetical protein DVH24_003520 [Malus domestica]|uniref:S-locus glycoprotein domain-containing protein n=1 Tax=Malus domestica TaxID=3750 RepID=A0A498IM17_MALDO|nr:hypothetical protein DVH24_003520 [Malus domestica]